ncbi:FG-GAP repeat domain-containing protein [Ralstonia nicotianae]
MNLKLAGAVAIGISALALTACGGGGDGGSTTGTTSTVSPTPTVTMSFDQPKLAVGQTAKLTWTTTNATSCVASGAWSGTQATAGTSTQTASTAGQSVFTLACTGPGGSATQSATMMVPLPVQKTSYLNKVVAAAAIGSQPLPAEVAQGNAVAFADFFQEGTYSMVTHSLEYTYGDPSTQNKFGHIHFWKSVNGQWVDHTADILASNTGCLHPRKALVADFNGDGKPDVFFACHGYDGAPFPGEQPHYLLSQADGTYKNVTAPTTCFCHSASAADFSGNGYADVVVVDNIVHGKPYFLINDKNGSFAEDLTRLQNTIARGAPIFTAELIDFGRSQYDVFLSGDEQNGWNPTIVQNDGTEHFSTTKTLAVDAYFTNTLDVLFVNGQVYLNRVHVGSTGTSYGFSEIQKVDYNTTAASQIYTNTANFSNGMTWLNWIAPYNGKIVSLDSTYGVSVPQ